eukprot:3745725-Pleurochrysis_carterae.AAC.1
MVEGSLFVDCMFVLESKVQWIALEGEALRRALRWLPVESTCVRLLGTRWAAATVTRRWGWPRPCGRPYRERVGASASEQNRMKENKQYNKLTNRRT